jgi:hypothetical protein
VPPPAACKPAFERRWASSSSSRPCISQKLANLGGEQIQHRLPGHERRVWIKLATRINALLASPEVDGW